MTSRALPYLLVAALAVSACSAPTQAPVEKRINAEEALSSAPVVTSRATMKKYAMLFKTACLDEASGYAGTLSKFSAAGLTEIQGSVGGKEKRGAAYSDGTAYGHLFVRRDGYVICSVALKTYDDDPLVAELQDVVSSSQFAGATFSPGSLFGAGYTILKGRSADKIISVARERKSSQSPTSFTIIDFNK